MSRKPMLRKVSLMKKCSCDETPNEKWGLDRLGKFCAERYEQMAIDVWMVGKAMFLAKERCRKEGKQFTTWKREHKFSNATASRYMRVFQLYQSDEQLDQLKSIGPLKAYVDAGVEAPRERIPRQPRAGKKPSVSTDENPKPLSWAVEESVEQSTDKEQVDQTIELWSTSRCLEEELRKAIPWQVQCLKDKVAFLLTKKAEELRTAWSEDEAVRTRIAADIALVMALLPQLAATMPQAAADSGGNKRNRCKPAA